MQHVNNKYPPLPASFLISARLGPANLVVPFVACGDLSGFDADKSYPLVVGEEEEEGDGRRDGEFERIAPLQMPIRPPHETYQKRRSDLN